jgi:hypothetical protein
MLKARDLPQFWWELIQPPPCACGQSFDQEITEFARHEQGGFSLKCPSPSCGKLKRARIAYE